MAVFGASCRFAAFNLATLRLSVALGQEGRKRVASYITCVYLLRAVSHVFETLINGRSV